VLINASEQLQFFSKDGYTTYTFAVTDEPCWSCYKPVITTVDWQQTCIKTALRTNPRENSNLIEHDLTSPPTQYRLSGRRFYRSKTQPTVSKYWRNKNAQITEKYNKRIQRNTANPLVYTNIGWLGDGSHRGKGGYWLGLNVDGTAAAVAHQRTHNINNKTKLLDKSKQTPK